MMDKNLFWQIIGAVNSQVAGDDYAGILRVTQEELRKHSPEDIAHWGGIQRCYRDLADTSGVFAASCVLNEYMSDDSFMDFRMWLVSQGREVYMAALKNPDSLADLELPEDIQSTMGTRFERYGYVANYAYEDTGREIDFYKEMDEIHPMSAEEKEDLLAGVEYFPHNIPDQDAAKDFLPNMYAKYITPEIDFCFNYHGGHDLTPGSIHVIHTSQDFQCDATDGFPTVLCYDLMNNQAWLSPSPAFDDEDDPLCRECMEACQAWGQRPCESWEDYNELLKRIGEEAFENAAVEIEDQDMGGMGGMA